MNPPIVAQVLALLAALGFATADTAARLGMRTSTPLTAILNVAVVTLILFGPSAAITLLREEIPARGVIILVAAGVVSPGLAGTFFYLSFRRFGLSRSAIMASSAPLITVLLAVVALGERPKSLVYLGTLLIMGGVMLLAGEQRSAHPRKGKPFWRSFIFLALATLMFGVAALLRKVGLETAPTLSLALCMSAIGCLAAIAVLLPFFSRGDRLRFSRQSIGYFLANGVSASLGHLAFFAALKRAPLSLVAPLTYTTPLFVLAFSWFLLRETENLNLRVVIGAILICGGAAMVTLSRA